LKLVELICFGHSANIHLLQNLKFIIMKKLFTFLGLVSLSLLIFAQSQINPVTYMDKVTKSKTGCDNVISSTSKTDVLNETFTTWPPTDWELVNGTESVGNQHWHHAGNSYATVEYDNGDGVIHNQDEWMISPEFTVPVNAFLHFQFHSNPYWMVTPNDNADVNVKISTDGTNWTQLWNEDDSGFEYSVWTDAYVSLEDYVDENVKIAFQYVGIDACWFSVDNVIVYGLPEFDLEISDALINFFEIYDYHEDASDFHYSSHYQKIPMEIVEDNEYAYMAFNAIVTNKGYGTDIPQCNVIVKNPDGVEIYNMTSSHSHAIGEMESDTIDIAYEEGTEFLLEDPMLGIYTVEYTVYMQGQTPIDPHYIPGSKDVSTSVVTFEITNSTYARDNNNIDDFIGPQYWEDGGTDGDVLTVRYPFFENSLITSVSAFIHEDSDPGNALLCNVYYYDQGVSEYVSLASSSVVTIETEDIGSWVTFTFLDPAYITVNEGYAMTPILVGFEFYYSSPDSYLWLGCDKTVPSSSWGTIWKFNSGTSAGTWTAINNYVGVPMIRATLFNETSTPQNMISSKINVYPNPASDILIIDEVSDGRVEIGDNLGRVLDVIDINSEGNIIDISEYKQGNYFVKIMGVDGKTVTDIKRFSIIR